ncbi:MAG TPA: proprotein convertase P-domain-containing protein, partial [Polyangium sp.]|nr:proprotein convertase P-domain-containing protein [Polyangium sp.]
TVLEQDNDDGSFGATASSIAGTSLTQTGNHYFRVTGPGNGTIRPYDLHVKTQSGAPVAEMEPNDMAPNPLPASGWVTGSLSSATDFDPFTITVNAGDTIFASLDLDPTRNNTPWNGQLLIGPFGPTNTFLVINDTSTAAANSEAFPLTIKNAGTYAVVVNAPAGVTAVGDYNLSVSVHPATPEGVNCQTYTSTDTPKPIPDLPGTVSSTIMIPPNIRIGDLDVSLNLSHTVPADLDITLTSPAGNTNAILTDSGGVAGTNQTAWDVTLDDEATIPPVFTVLNGVHYQPRTGSRLDWYDGENAGGMWTLTIADDTATNTGTLNNWSMTICEPPPAPTCAGGTALRTIFGTDFELDNGGFTHAGTQDEWEYGRPTFAPITGCNSGMNCWKTDLDNTYNASSTQNLVSVPINLTNRVGPVRLQWAMKYQFESASFDHAWVEVREVGGANSRRVWEYIAPTMTAAIVTTTIQQSAGWGIYSADITAYAGKQIEVVFHLDSDASNNYGGFAVDDVFVSACNPAFCGDGTVNGAETCDDANMMNGDGCDNNCTISACGNGIPAGMEACDDGNMT